MELTRRTLHQPYLAFFRSGVKWPGLLCVHWVTSVSGGRTDIAACGHATGVHQWYAVNDAKDNALRARFVACLNCAAIAPDQFHNIPRTL